jgi:hypothetical protein
MYPSLWVPNNRSRDPRQASFHKRRRFVEVRLVENGSPLRWAMRFDPRVITELCAALELGQRMSEEIP